MSKGNELLIVKSSIVVAIPCGTSRRFEFFFFQYYYSPPFVNFVWKSLEKFSVLKIGKWNWIDVDPGQYTPFPNWHFDASRGASSQSPSPKNDIIDPDRGTLVHLENLGISLSSLLHFKVVRRWKKKQKIQNIVSVNVLFNPLTLLRREDEYIISRDTWYFNHIPL